MNYFFFKYGNREQLTYTFDPSKIFSINCFYFFVIRNIPQFEMNAVSKISRRVTCRNNNNHIHSIYNKCKPIQFKSFHGSYTFPLNWHHIVEQQQQQRKKTLVEQKQTKKNRFFFLFCNSNVYGFFVAVVRLQFVVNKNDTNNRNEKYY